MMRYEKIFILLLLFFGNLFVLAQTDNINKGKFTNIVVFVRFAEDDEYDNNFSYYDSIFNSSIAISLYDYYKEVSYNQFEVNSYFLHKDTIISYKDKYASNYYLKQTKNNNIGYINDDDASERKSTLLKNIFNFIQKNIDKNLNVDANFNGIVDNITIILSGIKDETNYGNSVIMWPHQDRISNSKYGFTTFINNKEVSNYIIIPSKLLYLGLLCHEFFHTLGAPDLYHSNKINDLTPVYYWDLMESQYIIPQHMSAYMKFRYGKWINNIPNITKQGEYYLKSLTQQDSNCYTISTPFANEYLVLEYRNPEGKYENSLSSMLNKETGNYIKNYGGLLIYRINKSKDGVGNYNADIGTPDEIYCYRPDGTNINNGKPWEALFNNRYGRNKFDKNTNPAPIKFDGDMLNVSISDIYESNNKLYFTMHSTEHTFIKYPTHLETEVSLKPVIKWDLLENNRIYAVQISELHNFSTFVVDDIIINDSLCFVKNALKPDFWYYLRVGVIGKNDTNWTTNTLFHTTKHITILNNFTQYCAGDSIEIYYECVNSNPYTNVYLMANDEIIKKQKLLNNVNLQSFGTIICNIPKNIPTGYRYKLLFQDQVDTNNKIYSSIFRIKGLPEAKFEPFDTLLCKNSVSIISFIPIDSNVKYSNHKYSWQVKNGTIQKINDTNYSITILWENLGEGEIKIIAENEMGCKNEYSKKVNIIDFPKIKFVAKNIVCPNIPISYYLPENKSVTTQIEITNGIYERKNKDSIYITWNNVDTGYIKIISSINNCSDSLIIKQNIKIMPEVSIVGIDGFCKNDTAEYSIDVSDEEYIIQWNCNNANIIEGQNKKICKITSNKDTIYLESILTNKITNCSKSITKKIIIYDLPEIPIVNFNNISGKLECSIAEENYQWFFNNEPIKNSNSQTITPKDSGNYYVIVENIYGCKNQSVPYNMPTAISENNNNYNYNFIQKDNIVEVYFADKKQNVIMELYDLIGNKLLLEKYLQVSEVSYDISLLPNGIYFLRLYLDNHILNYTIIKSM